MRISPLPTGSSCSYARQTISSRLPVGIVKREFLSRCVVLGTDPCRFLKSAAVLVILSAFQPAGTFTADFDGDVDGDDLAQWQGDFGASALSDADNDGDSDGADFLAWQRQLGATAPAASTAETIPEPTSALLAIATLLAFIVGDRRWLNESIAGPFQACSSRRRACYHQRHVRCDAAPGSG
jgi:hypothetical protein